MNEPTSTRHVVDDSDQPSARELEHLNAIRAIMDGIDSRFREDSTDRRLLAATLADWAKATRALQRAAARLWERETGSFDQAVDRTYTREGMSPLIEPYPDPDPVLRMLWEELDVFAHCDHTLVEASLTAEHIATLLTPSSSDIKEA
ncbi:hypothetical protein COO72_10845 [Bifidobacterium callitrichos]|nr:hypothetical protein COO72_10845 [Bifidobacterium callitrichos]